MATPKSTISLAARAKAERIAERLRNHHRLGTRANSGRLSLNGTERHNEYTLDKFQAFAREYSQYELDELCQMVRPNGLPLHWGYIPYLLTIQAKAAAKLGIKSSSSRAKDIRRKFQRLAIRNGWSVAELRAKIESEFPTPPAARRGRRMLPPKDLALGLIGFRRDLDAAARRAELLAVLAKEKGQRKVAQELMDLASTLSGAQSRLKAKSAHLA